MLASLIMEYHKRRDLVARIGQVGVQIVFSIFKFFIVGFFKCPLLFLISV